MKNILIAVTGMTPAVVTETLYAIHRDDLSWPEKILILTTKKGRDKLAEGLPKAIGKLCREYKLTPFNNSDIDIRVIPDAHGNPIEDARSREDHEALGDFIMQTVRDISADDNTAIHASIAGGRKTMTYYLGYAMSLFGRPQDCLSHVLISAEHENLPGFFYPTPEPEVLKHHNGEARDASEAEVMLADIPFIRIRDSLPKVLLGKNKALKFRDLVRQIELGDREKHQRGIRLQLPLDFCGLRLSSKDGKWQQEIPLKAVDYALYRAIVRPQISGEDCWKRPADKEKDADIAYGIFHELGQTFDQPVDEDQILSRVADQAKDFEDTAICQRPDPRTLADLQSGLSGNTFGNRLNTINSIINEELPQSMARWLELRAVQQIDATPLNFYGTKDWPGRKKGGRYGVALQTDQIDLIDR